jgi:peptidoglycan/LPS O-acetylase OafA/YrhL
MNDQLQKISGDRDLTRGFICGIAAAVIMSYVASVKSPHLLHVWLALAGVAAIVGAYLSIAQSKADPELKGLVGLGGAVVSIACFLLLSTLY